MIDKKSFQKFYNDLYKDILNEYYNEVEKNIKTNKMSFFFIIIIFGVLPTLLFWNYFFEKRFLFQFIIITIFYDIGIFLLTKYLHKINHKNIIKNIKYKILDDFIILLSQDDKSEVLPNNRISKDTFQKAELFNLDTVNYYGKNFIETTINNRKIVIGDINFYIFIEKQKQDYYYANNRKYIRYYIHRKKKDIFDGCYIGSDINRNNDALIQVVPHKIQNKLLIDKNYYLLYKNKIALENTEFSNKYNVYSDDEIRTRMILTLPMMEKILELDNIISNPKYIIFKPDGRYSLFIEGITIEDIIDIDFFNNYDFDKQYDQFLKIFNNLANLFKIADIMNKSR